MCKFNNYVAKHSARINNKGGVHDKDNKSQKKKRQRKNAKLNIKKQSWIE